MEFIVVYVAEAHASDRWPLGHFVDIPEHTCLADRRKASEILRSKGLDPAIPIYLDTMQNSFDNAFAVWPERYYIAYNGVFQYVASPTTEYGYDRHVLKSQIDSLSNAILRKPKH